MEKIIYFLFPFLLLFLQSSVLHLADYQIFYIQYFFLYIFFQIFWLFVISDKQNIFFLTYIQPANRILLICHILKLSKQSHHQNNSEPHLELEKRYICHHHIS